MPNTHERALGEVADRPGPSEATLMDTCGACARSEKGPVDIRLPSGRADYTSSRTSCADEIAVGK